MRSHHVCSTVAYAIILAFWPSAVPAADDAPPKPDIITLCYATAEACYDACDRGAMTGAQFAQCERNCSDALAACQKSSERGATTTGVRPKQQATKLRNSN